MDDRERRRIIKGIRAKAKKRARKLTGLMWHGFVFVMAQSAVYAINMEYTPDNRWFVWPLAAWGAGLLMHIMATFQGGSMTEQMIEAEIEREMRKAGLE